MGKINKTIRFLGEVVALTTEKTLKCGSKILIKNSNTENKINYKETKLYRASDTVSDKIIEKSKKIGEFCDTLSKEAFLKETKIYGNAKYIYKEEAFVDGDFSIEE